MDVPITPFRDSQPLKHRRVRHDDGREGVIVHAWPDCCLGDRKFQNVSVHFDGDMSDGPYSYPRTTRCYASDLTLLDAPEIAAPVYVRRVLFRGHKEQVAEKWQTLAPLSDDQVSSGARRYVEFDPQPAAYRRWRIVYVGPPMDPAEAAEAPDTHPAAERIRRNARDSACFG